MSGFRPGDAALFMRIDGKRTRQLDRDGVPQPVVIAYLTRREVWTMIWEWIRVGLRRDMSRGPLLRRRVR